MAGYNEIRGLRVKYLSDDPSNAENGQVWYNSTTGNLRVQGIGVGAWSSTSPVNTARSDLAGFGIQTAAVGAGGYITGAVANVEEYNGTGWSNATSIPTATNSLGGFGILTAGVVAGGVSGVPVRPAATFEYDGTSWTGGGNLNTGRQNGTGAGTLTAGLLFGSSNPDSNLCEEYNGTAWTAVNAMNRPSINNMSAGGVQTAAYGAGGYIPGSGNSNGTENYDGTNWTTSGNIPAARRSSRGSGTQTDGIMAGGNGPGITTAVLNYNGTTWSVNPASLATAREGTASSQNAPASTTLISFGYDGSGRSSLSEEYNFSSSTVTAGAWASGGALSTARRGSGSGKNSQTLTAGLVFGGGGSPYGPVGIATEEYDGSSFSGGGNMNTPRYLLGGAGTQTSALGAGGYSYPPPASIDAVEEYNGSSWTNVTSLPQIRQDMSSFGTQTAAILASGRDRPGAVTYSTTLSYNGTSWTALGSPANVNTARIALSGSGTQTAGLATGGNTSPYKQTEEWNGSAWTSQNSTTSEHRNVNSQQLGIQTNALICGGGPSPTTATEGYDGTSWSTRPNMATGRYNSAGGGSATSGFIAGGFTTANTAATEEFTGETVTANPASNLSVS